VVQVTVVPSTLHAQPPNWPGALIFVDPGGSVMVTVASVGSFVWQQTGLTAAIRNVCAPGSSGETKALLLTDMT